MSERSVWVIEHSDYRVVGVFSSPEKAQQMADAINAAGGELYGATVAEWVLDPAVDEMTQGFKPHRVLMLRDGTVEKVDVQALDPYDLAGWHRVWQRSRAPAYRGRGIPDVLDALVWARDEKHAVKITNERRVQMIASGEWK